MAIFNAVVPLWEIPEHNVDRLEGPFGAYAWVTETDGFLSSAFTLPPCGASLTFWRRLDPGTTADFNLAVEHEPGFTESTSVFFEGAPSSGPAWQSRTVDLSNYNGEDVKLKIAITVGMVGYDEMGVSGQQCVSDYVPEAGEPVDVVGGAFTHQNTDIAIPGRGVPLEFTRYYTSSTTADVGLGHGWTHTYSASALEQVGQPGEPQPALEGAVHVSGADGSLTVFRLVATVYVPPEGVHDTLVKSGSDFVLTKPDQTEFTFDVATGRLESIADRNDNTTTVFYDGGGDLDYVEDGSGRRLTFTVDGNGRIELIAVPLTRTVEFDYDGNGDLETVTDVKGGTAQFTYAEHQLLTIVDSRGKTVNTNIYDLGGRVVEQTDSLGNTSCFYYGHGPTYTSADCTGLSPAAGTTIYVDPNGNDTTYFFNSSFRTTDVVDALGNPIHLSYTGSSGSCAPAGNFDVCEVTDPLGHVIKFTWDGSGNLLTRTNALLKTWTLTYNSLNDVLTENDPLNRTTEYTYDGAGNLTDIVRKNSLGATVGNPIVLVPDISGNGDLRSITDGNGNKTEFSYDSNGLLLFVTDPLPVPGSTEYVFDDGGRLLCVNDPEGNRTAFEYDAQDNLTFLHDAENTTSQSSNCLFTPTGFPTEYQYDAKGNRTSVTNNLGKETTFVYDDMSRLISITNPIRQAVGPPETGAQCGTTGGNGNGVDEDLDTVEDDGCLSATFTYDANGNLKTETDSRVPNRTVTYVYDVLDRITDIEYPDEDYDVQLTYFDDGPRKSMTDKSGITSYLYFDDERLRQVTDPQSNEIKYGYDDVGNRTKITYPNGDDVDYTYDDFDRMKDVTDWLMNVTMYTYDNAGNSDLTTTDLSGAADDLTADRDYDEADRLTLRTNKLDTTTLSSYAYDDLDKVGNRLEVTDTGSDVTTYVYDDLYRLTDVTYPAPASDTAAYEYDRVGNRTKLTTVDGPTVITSYLYDDADRLIRLCDGATCDETTAGTEYGFEAIGSITYFGENAFAGDPDAQFPGDPDNQFALIDYEARYLRIGHCFDQLTSDPGVFTGNVDGFDIGVIVAAFGSTESSPLYDPLMDLDEDGPRGNVDGFDISRIVLQFGHVCSDNGQFFYNGDGLRVQKWAGSFVNVQKTDYVWDVGAALPVVLEEKVTDDAAGVSPTVTTFYNVYGLDLIARVELDPDPPMGADIDTYYLYDGLGSTTSVTDNVGTETDTYLYDAFGASRGGSGSSDQSFKFTGELEDGDGRNELYYLRARYYDPKLGRFWTQDPLPVGNLYSYVGNNPVLYVDPYGLFCPLCDKVGAVVSGASDVFDTLVPPVVQDWVYEHRYDIGQTVTGLGITVFCAPTPGSVLCVPSLLAYGAITYLKIRDTDGNCQKGLAIATGLLGGIPGGTKAIVKYGGEVAAGFSGGASALCPTTVYSGTGGVGGKE